MRIPVNLASEPFRRDRPLIVASTAVSLLLIVSAAVLIWLALAERDRTAHARATLASLTAQLNAMNREQTRIERVLLEPRNAEVLDKSQFVNLLLDRKAVSWTRIFADLEKVMPHNVRVIQVRPQIGGNNELALDMVVASQSGEAVVGLLNQLSRSEVFSNVSLHTSLPPSQTDPQYRYRVSVRYAQKL